MRRCASAHSLRFRLGRRQCPAAYKTVVYCSAPTSTIKSSMERERFRCGGMRPFEQTSVILVIEDVEETRIGIERLLSVDGYRVLAAKGQADPARMSHDVSPDLVLISL